MQKCSYCGGDLPENTRFCGKCGNVQDVITTDAATTVSNTPQPQSWISEGGTIPATWSPNVQASTTPPPAAENEDESRRGIPPWSPLDDVALGGEVLLSSGQAYTPGVPVVQGTPQAGSVPGVAGSPTPSTNAPVNHPVQGSGNAPVNHPVQGSGNAPINHPVTHPVQGPTHVPVTHPVQGPTHVPVNHPVQGPTHAPVTHPVQGPIHKPPEPPGTHEHHPVHKHHPHHDHPEEHEQHQHHTHPARHELHRAGHVTKLAGGSTVKIIILVVTAVAVVAAGGVAAAVHFLARPQQPLISINSNYKVDNVLAGANGTILHISGQKFSSNSAITFLLDGHAAPGNPATRSDSNGNFSTDMTITSAWSVGTHTLTAKDASNDSTNNSVSVTIVQPGQANTPGPDGAPPDDASFKVIAQIQGSQSTETEVVTGHPDPMGGTVCQPEDRGQPIVTTGFTYNTHIPVRSTNTYSCTGSYKGGKLTLTETLMSQVSVYSQPDGTTATCTLNSPQIDEQLSGSYTGNNTFSGTITYPAIPASDFSCKSSNGFNKWYLYQQVSWTGQVTNLHS